MSQIYFVLDVESLGLYGLSFAWGYTVVDTSEQKLGQGCAACIEGFDWEHAAENADPDDAKWVIENVLPALRETSDRDPLVITSNAESFAHLREMFWEHWIYWKELGATLAADCPYPVETNFLAAVVRDRLKSRKWSAPYPLIGIEAVLLAAGMNPLGEYDRLPDELPKHNPLCDARQSARLLLEALRKTGAIKEANSE